MGKTIKAKTIENRSFELIRYLIGGKFRFTVKIIDNDENTIEENEYNYDSVFEQFDLLTLEYDFSELA